MACLLKILFLGFLDKEYSNEFLFQLPGSNGRITCMVGKIISIPFSLVCGTPYNSSWLRRYKFYKIFCYI